MTGQCYICASCEATPGQLYAIGEKAGRKAYMLRLLDDGIGTENMKLFTIKGLAGGMNGDGEQGI